jgi:hypothetical protein
MLCSLWSNGTLHTVSIPGEIASRLANGYFPTPSFRCAADFTDKHAESPLLRAESEELYKVSPFESFAIGNTSINISTSTILSSLPSIGDRSYTVG